MIDHKVISARGGLNTLLRHGRKHYQLMAKKRWDAYHLTKEKMKQLINRGMDEGSGNV